MVWWVALLPWRDDWRPVVVVVALGFGAAGRRGGCVFEELWVRVVVQGGEALLWCSCYGLLPTPPQTHTPPGIDQHPWPRLEPLDIPIKRLDSLPRR
jgi:hypothetical protein